MDSILQTSYLELDTQGYADIQPVTSEVAARVTESGMRAGTATLFVPATTAAITTMEWEPGCVEDLRRILDEIAGPDRTYQHNLSAGDSNGMAHVRATLLGPSLTIPVVEGALAIGIWQQIVFIDFDDRPRRRRLIIQLMGV